MSSRLRAVDIVRADDRKKLLHRTLDDALGLRIESAAITIAKPGLIPAHPSAACGSRCKHAPCANTRRLRY
jgi:hypothetical protein